jgi:MFS family permease
MPGVLHVPGVRRTLLLALLARIPIGALGLLMVLAVRHAGHSYALAGLASGGCSLGVAGSAPVLGRLMDRFGQTLVLVCASMATVVVFCGYLVLPEDAPGWAFPAAAVLYGLALPPVSASVRVVWRRLLDGPGFNQVVTLDASLQELSFMVGPLILVTLATHGDPAAVLALTGVAWATITVAFALLPETRAVPGAHRPHAGSLLGPLRDRGVVVLLLVAVALGFCIGASELGVITLADQHHARGATGLLYGCWSLGSLVGGLLFARRRIHDTVSAARWFTLIVAVTTAVLALAPTPVVLGALLLFAGVANAPLFGALYTLMADIAPGSMVTEAFSLQSSGLTVGIALGAAVAGGLANHGGPHVIFLVAALAMLGGVAVQRGARAALTPSAGVAEG